MSKLLNLKEWLPLGDAARHLSIVFGEDVTEADVLRLGLDGRLRLSVYFVNHVKARCGKVVPFDETVWELVPRIFKFPKEQRRKLIDQLKEPGEKLRPSELGDIIKNMPVDESEKYYPLMRSRNIEGKRFLTLSDDVTTLCGVWDLQLIAAGRIDIECQYQKLTGGPSVILETLEGIFVEGRDGQVFQLQQHSEGRMPSTSEIAKTEWFTQQIHEKRIDGEINGPEDVVPLLSQLVDRQFEMTRETKALSKTYYSADTLPEDAVIVVRTEALREFEMHGNGAPLPTSRAHVSDKLAKLNQAAEKFWKYADRDDRGTHSDNAQVAAWLETQGFSSTLADKAATIIRPEWVPTGRKPEE